VVERGSCWISGIAHRLGVPGRGVLSWALRGVEGLSEIPETDETPPSIQPTPEHPNGVVALDHIVIATPNPGRTITAFESAGIALRRTRNVGTPDRLIVQSFFRLGPTIAEVVGPADGSGEEAAHLSGRAFTVSDLDATARFLASHLRPAKAAVQPGRRIATLDRSAGSTVPMAFMSPDERR